MLTMRLLIAFTFLLILLPATSPRAALTDLEHDAGELVVERVIEGRVTHLQSRLGPQGYPVTEVLLEPGGERFTILGGYQNGIHWTAEEEAQLALGEEVRVRLEQSPVGWRPAGGCLGVDRLDTNGLLRAPPGERVDEYDAPAQVMSVTPPSGPAVADGSIEVIVEGINFGDRPGDGGIFFQGLFEHVPAEILEWSDRRIRCLVPRPGRRGRPQLFSGAVKVWTPGGGWSDGQEWSGGAKYAVEFQYAGDFWDPDRLPMDVYLNLRGFPWPHGVVRGLLSRAVGAWNQVPFSYGKFAYRGDLDQQETRKRDGINLIGWTSPWPHPESWLAVTWSAIDSLTGKRLETDVEFNGERAWSIATETPSNSYDVLTTLIHELGHWFRLGHVSEPGQVMSIFQSLGERRRALGSGDRQGASWIYPTFGKAHVSADSVYFGGPRPDTLTIDVQIADRRGRPLAGLQPEEVVALPEPAEGNSSLKLSTTGTRSTNGWLFAESATDEEGRTRIVIPEAQGEGLVRLRIVGGNGLLRDSPEVFVSDRGRPGPGPLLSLGSVYPNPSAGNSLRASVRLTAPVPRLLARVFDARGRGVRVLYDAAAGAGEMDLILDSNNPGARMAPGLYFLQVRVENTRETRKFVLLGG
jgi:hypothetical protein